MQRIGFLRETTWKTDFDGSGLLLVVQVNEYQEICDLQFRIAFRDEYAVFDYDLKTMALYPADSYISVFKSKDLADRISEYLKSSNELYCVLREKFDFETAHKISDGFRIPYREESR